MKAIPDDVEKCLCNICKNEVPLLTKKLQESKGATRWKKFGKCCVTCMSDNYSSKGSL